MGRRPRTAGPYRRLTEWLADQPAFVDQARIAERIGVDPVTVVTETDYRNRAVRSAAALVLFEDDRKRAEEQKRNSK